MVGKGVKEATLTAFAVRGEGTNDKAFTTTTDSAGHFLFEGLDFQDTTVFMIPFYNKRGRIPVRQILLPSKTIPESSLQKAGAASRASG